MQSNTRRTPSPAPRTHQGAVAARINPYQQLRRSVLACLLGENEFYESGQLVSDRIKTLVAQVPLHLVAGLAIEAREVQHLRHVPLLLVREMARRGGPMVAPTLERVVQRADELAEFLAMYWGGKRTPISKQVRKGLAAAFGKFNAYQLAKYNRDKAVTLRDVMFMVHPKPKDEQQAAVWKQLAENTLPAPDTWEVQLSAGKDKRATFERLIREGNLGYFALLRNLRGMLEAGVPRHIIEQAILARGHGADKILPFRFIAAARAAPQLEQALDQSLAASVELLPLLKGNTAVLVDVSGSMDKRLSSKSDLTRMDAACALASVIRAENLRVFSFSDRIVEVPPRRGMAGVDAVRTSQRHSGTDLAGALRRVNALPYDRLIVITDEQAMQSGSLLPRPGSSAYMINVSTAKNGVGYGKHWQHLDGFSEGVLHWIAAFEADSEASQVGADGDRW